MDENLLRLLPDDDELGGDDDSPFSLLSAMLP